MFPADCHGVDTFMRVTYPHIFEIRLISIVFNVKNMNLEILTIFYSHIIRIFYKFICSFHFVAKLRIKNVIFYLIYI